MSLGQSATEADEGQFGLVYPQVGFDESGTTPILTFPHEGGRDWSYPLDGGELEWG